MGLVLELGMVVSIGGGISRDGRGLLKRELLYGIRIMLCMRESIREMWISQLRQRIRADFE